MFPFPPAAQLQFSFTDRKQSLFLQWGKKEYTPLQALLGESPPVLILRGEALVLQNWLELDKSMALCRRTFMKQTEKLYFNQKSDIDSTSIWYIWNNSES